MFFIPKKSNKCGRLHSLILFGLSLILLSFNGYAQGIIVDDTGYSSQALAELLVNDGCVDIQNSSRSSSAAVAYFNSNGSDFPIEEGVIIRTGRAKYSEGTYTGSNLSSSLNNNSDPFLEDLNNSEGQPTDITDVAFLEFDFVPLSHNFEFNFLFASNEYGEWQCMSSDIFAFLITDIETEETENIALVPGTTTPISVKNIRDSAYNAGCGSQNSQYFDTYNVDDPDNSSVNMKGYTTVMTATSTLVPGKTYRIRLVIGDSNDAKFDSAVFLEAGSFDVSFGLGPDQVICQGDERELTTGLPEDSYMHQWIKDGQTLPETGPTLTITETGVYKVIVTKEDSGCELTDTVVFTELAVDAPDDLAVCDAESGEYIYNLTHNNANGLNINSSIYKVRFYESLENAQNDNRIPSNQLTNYHGTEGQEIFIRIYNEDTGFFCDAIYSFFLLVNDAIVAADPDPIEVCYDEGGYVVDLTIRKDQILDGQNPADFIFSYYESDPGESLQVPINNPSQYALPFGFGSKIIWVRMRDKNDANCYDIVELEIIELPEVEVSELEDVMVCEFFELPEIEHGNYFTEPNGEGTPLFPGDIIDEEGNYYIYNVDPETGCFNGSSFNVVIIEKYDVAGTYCGEFVLDTPPAGNFYTAPGGPNGGGEFILGGTVITQTTTVYYYAELDGEFCRDDPMEIVIHPLPVIDNPSDVIICGSYTLPPLNGGSYYTQSSGGGQQLSAGHSITSTTKIYVYANDGVCSDQNEFMVYIVPEFEDVEACGSYTLPNLEIGGFYTQSKGQGQEIPEGTVITTSQKVYYYVQTTSSPNCTNYMSFEITIKPVPEVDVFDDVKLCEEEEYVLPELVHGSYFTAPGRGGDELEAGEIIREDQLIYINNELDGCENESSFMVSFSEYPEISNFTDIYTCDPYVVPTPAHGTIYTQPGGQGNIVYPGQQLWTTQTLYIYNRSAQEPYCESEESFTVFVNYVNLGEFQDVTACDFYVLPELTEGDYYSETNANGQQYFAGDTLTESQTIYVYKQKGDRFICKKEKSFEVQISETPELPEFEDMVVCGSYELPDLEEEDFDIGYYWDSHGQHPIEEEDYVIKPGEYTIYVRGKAFDNENCYDQQSFTLIVNPLNEMYIENATICVDPETRAPLTDVLLESGIDSDLYEINWYKDDELVHTGENFLTEVPGTYVVTATYTGTPDGIICDYKPFTVKVHESSRPVAIAYVLTPDFSDQATVRVDIINGVGSFVYSMDGGPFQHNNIFTDVSSGTHSIRVKDINGVCGETILYVTVIKYPKFFTPNGDGINDKWNIKDLEGHPEARIYIFDRYGKLLRTIRPDGEGWDGYYNGKAMPSNDYWFKVNYQVDGEDRVFKANFTLKR